ncbi:MAG TPA: hypothetical protein VK446_17120 [Methylocystis sp.]|nr:hypothetical protein [Methylocystis sp.]
MKKLASAVAISLFAASPAWAGSLVWQVTEESDIGVKGAQGSWKLSQDGDKITGVADLMHDDGSPLTYKVEGTVAGTNYTIKLVDRSDGKKECVWTGHPPTGAGTQTQGLVGWAPCSGGKLIIRAAF